MKPHALSTTGYLAQVVERVLPTEPTLQRRQPALFEPVQQGAGARLQDALDEVRESSPKTGWHGGPTVTAPPPAHRAEAPQPRREAPAAVKREGTLPREPPVIDASIRVVTGSPPQRAAPARLAPPAAASVAVAASRPPEAVRAEPPPAVRRLPSRATGDAVPELRQRQSKPGFEVTLPQRDRHADAALPFVARPSVRPAMPSRAALRAAAQAAVRPTSPPPVRELPPVQVTIGRVEVRAVAAPTPVPTGRRAAPKLSLEQYLRDRNGGGR